MPVIKDFSVSLINYTFENDEASFPVNTEAVLSLYDTYKRELEQEVAGLRKPRKKVPPADGDMIDVGIDCEYQRVKNGQRNSVLSYQAVVRHKGKQLSIVAYPKGPKAGQRFSFKAFMGFVVDQAIAHDVIQKYPAKINVFGHFLRADLPCFKDHYANKRGFDIIGGTFVSKGESYGIDWAAENSRSPLSGLMVLTNKHRKPRSVKVRFIDTILLTPGRAGLASVGAMLNLPKIDIDDDYSITEMERFLKERKAAFEAYALRDAEITVVYGQMMQQFAKDLRLPGGKLPLTIGSIATKVLRETIGSTEDFNRIFGVNFEREPYYNEKTGRYSTRTVKSESIFCRYRSQAAAHTYSGGRNEAFMMGLLPPSVYFDWDLRGAYTTGLTSIYELDYESAYDCVDPEMYRGHVCGLATVKFTFPEGTRFPSLLVRGPYGLCYPLSGTSDCTAPEIEVALNLGAEIEILTGFIVPWVDRETSVFTPFVKKVRDKRAYYKALKDNFREQLWKEIGNSAYGKIGQAVKKKKVFDAATGLSKPLGPSALTNPYMAAFVTGFIRAVIAELLASIPSDRYVVSVTTDGFLTNAPREEIDTSGPLCSRYQDLCDALGDEADMLEMKGSLFQGICPKTRGLITTEEDPSSPKLILAKAGVKPPEDRKTRSEHNAYMLDLYFNRDHKSTVSNSHLISARDMVLDETDLITVERADKRLSLEFDMKRRLVNPRMMRCRSNVHVLCDSVPWSTAALSQCVRAYFDEWRRTNSIKTVEDHDRFEDFWKCRMATKGSYMKVTAEGSVGLLRRSFLRALVRNEWGLQLTDSHCDVAKWLTDVGFATTRGDLKEAGRQKLYAQVVPVTAGVISLLKVILERYPTFNLEKVFKPEDWAEVEECLVD
jgi:hypothetical protein